MKTYPELKHHTMKSGVVWCGVEWSGVEWSGVEWNGGMSPRVLYLGARRG
jgi:hypothetical protein